MSDDYIPIKKLSDVHNNEFYPLTAAKGVITTEDIAVKNILGGGKDKIDAGKNLFDILVQIFGTEFNIDVDTLTNETTRVVSSFLLTKILSGNSNLKFKICTYSQYQEWLDSGEIDDNTLYFTIKEYWTITLDANGGTVSPSVKKIERGSPYGTLPVPEYSGNTFLGWFTEASGGVIVSSTDIPTSDTTLYAHWTTSDDLLCIEENHDSLVSIEENKTWHIKLNMSDVLKLLSTEIEKTPIITEDSLYTIDIGDSTSALMMSFNPDQALMTNSKTLDNKAELEKTTVSQIAKAATTKKRTRKYKVK